MKHTVLAVAIAFATLPAFAETDMSTYPVPAPSNWEYLSDQVMGGVSQGQATQEQGYIRLTGTVSTENRGGFIQTRTRLDTPLPKGTQGLILRVRGNDTRYFVHLRTSGTRLPWQYYQAGFEVTRDWQEIRLPLEAFKPSGSLLRRTPRAESVNSVGFVAYGRDHEAALDAEWIGIY